MDTDSTQLYVFKAQSIIKVQIDQRQGAWNHLSYAVHVKPVRKHHLTVWQGLMLTVMGTYWQGHTHSQLTHTQSHTARSTLVGSEMAPPTQNKGTHSPHVTLTTHSILHCVTVWMLQPSAVVRDQTIFPSLKIEMETQHRPGAISRGE